MQTKTALKKEELIKEFDNRFETQDEDGNYMTMVIEYRSQVKDFLSTALDSLEKTVREENYDSAFNAGYVACAKDFEKKKLKAGGNTDEI